MDLGPNLASVMQALEVSGSFERLKDALLRGHGQCDSWEKVETGPGAGERIPNLHVTWTRQRMIIPVNDLRLVEIAAFLVRRRTI
jgi:hypothetical protein